MRRSVSGYIIYFEFTPHFLAVKLNLEDNLAPTQVNLLLSKALEEIKGVRIALQAFRVEVSEQTIIMFANSIICASTLKKRHVGITYHMCREAEASKTITVHHLYSVHNRADVFTKSLASPILHYTLISVLGAML